MGKNILISGYYGFDNFGDEAILGVLINRLKKDGHNITVLSVDPEKTGKKYNVNSLHSFNTKLIMERMPKFDMLISGGGSLLQNVTSNRSLYYYCGLIIMFAMLQKDVIIFAQGIGPVKGFVPNYILKYALKCCKTITVRDSKSLDLLKKFKIDANLVCDPVFDLQLPIPTRTRKIGIQLRKFNTLTDKLFDEIIKQVGIRFMDREIELISFQDAEDEGISQVFLNKLKLKYPTVNASLIKGLSTEQVVNRVSEYDCLIAMRYHACILGLKFGIKTLAISYDPKVETLAEDANIPYLVMNPDRNDYKKAFDDMMALTPFNLVNYANNQNFDWNITGIQ